MQSISTCLTRSVCCQRLPKHKIPTLGWILDVTCLHLQTNIWGHYNPVTRSGHLYNVRRDDRTDPWLLTRRLCTEPIFNVVGWKGNEIQLPGDDGQVEKGQSPYLSVLLCHASTFSRVISSNRDVERGVSLPPAQREEYKEWAKGFKGHICTSQKGTLVLWESTQKTEQDQQYSSYKW